jgi:hypothetical protein
MRMAQVSKMLARRQSVRARDHSSRLPLPLYFTTKAQAVSINILTVIQSSSRLLLWRLDKAFLVQQTLLLVTGLSRLGCRADVSA